MTDQQKQELIVKVLKVIASEMKEFNDEVEEKDDNSDIRKAD